MPRRKRARRNISGAGIILLGMMVVTGGALLAQLTGVTDNGRLLGSKVYLYYSEQEETGFKKYFFFFSRPLKLPAAEEAKPAPNVEGKLPDGTGDEGEIEGSGMDLPVVLDKTNLAEAIRRRQSANISYASDFAKNSCSSGGAGVNYYGAEHKERLTAMLQVGINEGDTCVTDALASLTKKQDKDREQHDAKSLELAKQLSDLELRVTQEKAQGKNTIQLEQQLNRLRQEMNRLNKEFTDQITAATTYRQGKQLETLIACAKKRLEETARMRFKSQCQMFTDPERGTIIQKLEQTIKEQLDFIDKAAEEFAQLEKQKSDLKNQPEQTETIKQQIAELNPKITAAFDKRAEAEKQLVALKTQLEQQQIIPSSAFQIACKNTACQLMPDRDPDPTSQKLLDKAGKMWCGMTDFRIAPPINWEYKSTQTDKKTGEPVWLVLSTIDSLKQHLGEGQSIYRLELRADFTANCTCYNECVPKQKDNIIITTNSESCNDSRGVFNSTVTPPLSSGTGSGATRYEAQMNALKSAAANFPCPNQAAGLEGRLQANLRQRANLQCQVNNCSTGAFRCDKPSFTELVCTTLNSYLDGNKVMQASAVGCYGQCRCELDCNPRATRPSPSPAKSSTTDEEFEDWLQGPRVTP